MERGQRVGERKKGNTNKIHMHLVRKDKNEAVRDKVTEEGPGLRCTQPWRPWGQVRIKFVTLRLGGKDGVCLEIIKWNQKGRNLALL